jgi:hypothetical protein
VTYSEAGFQPSIGYFLTESLHATFYVACRGWQTPYPQKRQQTLGETLQVLWKTPESPQNSGFARGSARENLKLSII